MAVLAVLLIGAMMPAAILSFGDQWGVLCPSLPADSSIPTPALALTLNLTAASPLRLLAAAENTNSRPMSCITMKAFSLPPVLTGTYLNGTTVSAPIVVAYVSSDGRTLKFTANNGFMGSAPGSAPTEMSYTLVKIVSGCYYIFRSTVTGFLSCWTRTYVFLANGCPKPDYRCVVTQVNSMYGCAAVPKGICS